MRKTLAQFFGVLASVAVTASALAESTFTFRSQRAPGQTDHAVVRLEVGGQTQYSEEGKPRREEMSVVCNLDYYEKTLDAPAAADALWRSVRDYQKVSVVVWVADGQFEPALRSEHNLISVEAGQETVLLFSPVGNLTREELDVIDLPANSLLLDRLLPEKPVTVDQSWPHSKELLAVVLGLDEVAKTTVQSTLKQVTNAVARFEIAGRVEGSVYGVSTKIEIKGKYRFDRRTKRIDWLGLLIKENRQGSPVADGVDAVSRLQMIVTPAQEPASLSDTALAKLALKPTPEQVYLTYESPGGDWQCLYDRRWYVHQERPNIDAAVLRLVDHGVQAGQCNLASLVQRDPEKLVSLEEFQEDVRQALGESFGEFVEASQSPSDSDYRVYRVVVEGTTSGIAMRWIYYLVANPQGRQVAFTFAVEQSGVERFADADKPLVQSLHFLDEKDQEKEGQGGTEKAKKEKKENDSDEQK